MVTYDDFLQSCYDLADDMSGGNKAFLIRTGNIGYRRGMRLMGKQFEERTKTTLTVSGQQYYQLPIDYEFSKTIKTLVGTYQYPTREVRSQLEWDDLNRITNISNTRPTRHFIRLNAGIGGSEIGFWPTPSASGNLITFVFEAVPADVGQPAVFGITGSLANGSNLLTDNNGTFSQAMVGRYLAFQPPAGDGQYYRITSVTSPSTLTIQNYYEGVGSVNQPYGVYDLFGIAEEGQMIPVYYTMWHFYLMRRNPDLAKYYKELHDFEMKQLNENENDKSHGTIISRESDRSRSLDYPEWFPADGISGS
jgi:hypothetical protein